MERALVENIGGEVDVAHLAAAEQIGRWRECPPAFVRECIRAEPEEWQDDGLWALVKNIENPAAPRKPRIAGKASKGPGKSALMSWMGWWFLVCWLNAKGVATSISGANLEGNLWAEFAKWQAESELLTSAFTHTASRIYLNERKELWGFDARTWSKDANASEQGKTLAGTHADYVMFLLDESGGIPTAVMAAAEAALANEGEGRLAWLVQMGNPTDLQGPLYDACTIERAQYILLEINGDPENPKRSKRVSLEWAQGLIDKWGRDNPFVRVNVLGQFPLGQSNVLVSADDASKASTRELVLSAFSHEPRILGVDVARFGEDRTVLFPRQGRIAFQPVVLRTKDTMEVAGQVARVIAKWRPHAVFVDAIGIGAGVVDRLQELGHTMVVGVEASSAADDSSYFNKRSEMWGLMAAWFRTGGSTPLLPELIREATAPTYKFTSSGKLQVEKTEDVKARLSVSPDLASALSLTFAYPVATPDPAGEHPDTAFLAAQSGRRVVQSHDYDPHGDA